MTKKCFRCEKPRAHAKAGYCNECYIPYNRYYRLHWRLENDFFKNNRYVYFISHPTEARIKIGITKIVSERIASISRQEDAKCEYLGFQIGGRTQEKYLHNLFSDIRLGVFPSGQEWFSDTPQLREYIEYHSTKYKRAEVLLYYAWLDHLAPVLETVPDEWKHLFDRFRPFNSFMVEDFAKRVWWWTDGITRQDYRSDLSLHEILAKSA